MLIARNQLHCFDFLICIAFNHIGTNEYLLSLNKITLSLFSTTLQLFIIQVPIHITVN